MRRRHDDDRGIALLSVLSILAVMLPLGALLVLQARAQALIARNVLRRAQAFTLAESGANYAVALAAREPHPEQWLNGPDGRAGTADDGQVPFPADASLTFPYAGRFRVVVSRVSPELLRFHSLGQVDDGGEALIQVTVRLTPDESRSVAVVAWQDLT